MEPQQQQLLLLQQHSQQPWQQPQQQQQQLPMRSPRDWEPAAAALAATVTAAVEGRAALPADIVRLAHQLSGEAQCTCTQSD